MAADTATGGSPFLRELKKQTSSFLKEKLQSARLALTDATRAQLLAEEVTGGNLKCPDTRTMAAISKAAFEIDDFRRVAAVLHKRLSRFDRKQWREFYNSLALLEHLLTHGPKSYSDEFQSDREVIREIASFRHIDETGFNWGLAVRKKAERVLKLLEKGPELCEERDRARKLAHAIRHGSFSENSSLPPSTITRKSEILSIQYIEGDSSSGSGSRREEVSCTPEDDDDDDDDDVDDDKENSISKVLVRQKSTKTENQGEQMTESLNFNKTSLLPSIRKRRAAPAVNCDLQEDSRPLLPRFQSEERRRRNSGSWKPALCSRVEVVVSFV